MFQSKYSSQEAVDQTSEADSLWEESSEHRSFVSPSSPFRQRAQSFKWVLTFLSQEDTNNNCYCYYYFSLKHLEPDSNLNALNEFYRNCFPKVVAYYLNF